MARPVCFRLMESLIGVSAKIWPLNSSPGKIDAFWLLALRPVARLKIHGRPSSTRSRMVSCPTRWVRMQVEGVTSRSRGSPPRSRVQRNRKSHNVRPCPTTPVLWTSLRLGRGVPTGSLALLRAPDHSLWRRTTGERRLYVRERARAPSQPLRSSH
jgi:hypothetical protein